MDGHCGTDAPRAPHIQVLAADARCGYRPVTTLPLSHRPADCNALLRQLGCAMPAAIWDENRIEALRIEDEEGQIFVYSMYDRACEFFNVEALTVGQMPAFKAAAALGLIN